MISFRQRSPKRNEKREERTKNRTRHVRIVASMVTSEGLQSENDTAVSKTKKDLQECFNCHAKGHYSSNCQRNAMFCTERRMNNDGSSFTVRSRTCEKPGVTRRRKVEGKEVGDILLDTGCSRTLVRQSLVPEEDKFIEGCAVAIRCAHGDTVLYPLAKVSVEVDGRLMEVEAAVSNTLPMSVLFGTDNPELKAS